MRFSLTSSILSQLWYMRCSRVDGHQYHLEQQLSISIGSIEGGMQRKSKYKPLPTTEDSLSSWCQCCRIAREPGATWSLRAKTTLLIWPEKLWVQNVALDTQALCWTPSNQPPTATGAVGSWELGSCFLDSRTFQKQPGKDDNFVHYKLMNKIARQSEITFQNWSVCSRGGTSLSETFPLMLNCRGFEQVY
jgi:hypothetical protein